VVSEQDGHVPDAHPKLTIAGEVERPLTVDPRDLAELDGEEVTVDFHCHEGWSRLGQRNRGLALRTLLRLAEARPAARYVTVASGGYSIVLTREQAEDQRVLLALEQDGAPLPRPRLVGPSEWDCFLSVKDVDRIELTRTAERATGPAIALARIGR
jgi:DMSO/TMAO reductase YedYZ molybdopterin-dependent catalytic subunit